MSSHIKRHTLLAITFTCSLLVSVQTPANNKNFNIKEKITEIRSQLSSEQSRQNRIQIQLQESETRINELRQKITQIDTEKKEITEKIKNFEEQEERLLEKKYRHQKVLSQQLRAAYKAGKESKIKLLLNQQNPEKIGRLLSYHNFLNIAREKKINELQSIIEEMKKTNKNVKEQVWQLSLKEEALEREQQALVKENTFKKNLLSKINSNISSNNRALEKLIANRKQLNTLIDKVKPAKKENKKSSLDLGNSNFAQSKGTFRWPVRGSIYKKFGSHITADLKREGIVIKSSSGHAVRAIHEGKIVYADWFKSKGLMVIISHGDGFMSLYAHNKSLLNKVGDHVTSGEKIALSGKSGNTPIEALYFEIRKNSQPLNPMEWLTP